MDVHADPSPRSSYSQAVGRADTLPALDAGTVPPRSGIPAEPAGMSEALGKSSPAMPATVRPRLSVPSQRFGEMDIQQLQAARQERVTYVLVRRQLRAAAGSGALRRVLLDQLRPLLAAIGEDMPSTWELPDSGVLQLTVRHEI